MRLWLFTHDFIFENVFDFRASTLSTFLIHRNTKPVFPTTKLSTTIWQ